MIFGSCLPILPGHGRIRLSDFVLLATPVWDMDRAHDLINHFATAFLLAELKGDAEAAKALAPENVRSLASSTRRRATARRLQPS